MDNRKVLLVNMSQATVNFSVPNSNFSRTLKGEGAKTYVPFDIMFEGLSEPGVDILFQEGFLHIEDKQDRIDLGLDTIAESDATLMSREEMLEILKENNPVKVKAVLDSLALEQKKKLAHIAIENDIYTAGLAKLIKDATGIDILAAIKNKRDAAE